MVLVCVSATVAAGGVTPVQVSVATMPVHLYEEYDAPPALAHTPAVNVFDGAPPQPLPDQNSIFPPHVALVVQEHAPHATVKSGPTTCFSVASGGHATSPSWIMHARIDAGGVHRRSAHVPAASAHTRWVVDVTFAFTPVAGAVHVPGTAVGPSMRVFCPNVPLSLLHAPLFVASVAPVDPQAPPP